MEENPEQQRLIEELERVEEEEEEQDLLDQAFRQHQDESCESDENLKQEYCSNALSLSCVLFNVNNSDEVQTPRLGFGLGLEIRNYGNSNSAVWKNRGLFYSEFSWLHPSFASHNFNPHEFKGEQFKSAFVQNGAQASNGSLFQWTPGEEVKKDKLSWMIDFRTLFSSSDPASESVTEFNESSEIPAPASKLITSKELFSNLVLKTHFKIKKKMFRRDVNLPRRSNNFYSSTATTKASIPTTPIKNEKVKGYKELKCNEVVVQPLVDLKELYDFSPFPLDSSVWVNQDEEEENQVEEPRESESSPQKTQTKEESTAQKRAKNSKSGQFSQRLKIEHEQLALFYNGSESTFAGLPVSVPVIKKRQNFELVESALLKLGFNPEEIEKIKRLPSSLVFSNVLSSEIEDPKSQRALLLKDSELALAFKNYRKAIRIYSRALKIPNLTLAEKSSLRLKRSEATLNLLSSLDADSTSNVKSTDVKVKGHLQRAREDAEKVTLDHPGSWFGFYQLGHTCLFQNQFEGAKLAYENALKVIQTYSKDSKEKQGYLDLKDHWRILMTRQYCEFENRFKAASSDLSGKEIARLLHRHPVKIKLNDETEISSKLMDRILKRMKTHKNKRVVALEFVYRANSLKFRFQSNSSSAATANTNANEIRDKEIAELYSKGAKRKNSEALYNLAMLHFEGRGVLKGEEKGIKLLKQLALFSVDKDVEEEKCQFKDIDGMVQFPEPRKIFVTAAMYELGRRSMSQGEKEEWYTKAKDNGSDLAANDLAMLIKSKYGAHKQIDRIIELFKTAAEPGLALAMRNLAWAHLQRYCAFDDKSDVKKAEYWFQKSLEENGQKADPNPDPELLREKQDFETCVEKLRGAAESWQQKYDKFNSDSNSNSNLNTNTNCGENPENPKIEETLENSALDDYFLSQKEIEAEASKGIKGAQKIVDIMKHFTSGLISLEKYVHLEENPQQETDDDDGNLPLSVILRMEILHEFAQSIILGAHLSLLTQEDKENLQTIAHEIIEYVDPCSCEENSSLFFAAKIVLEFLVKGSLKGILDGLKSMQTETKTEVTETKMERKEIPDVSSWLPPTSNSIDSGSVTETKGPELKSGNEIDKRPRQTESEFVVTVGLFSIMLIVFTNWCNYLISFSSYQTREN